MKGWMQRHGTVVSRISIVSAICAIFLPVLATLATPAYVDGSFQPLGDRIGFALAISVVCAVVALVTGLTAWIARAPSYYLGATAILLLGMSVFVVAVWNLYVDATWDSH